MPATHIGSDFKTVDPLEARHERVAAGIAGRALTIGPAEKGDREREHDRT